MRCTSHTTVSNGKRKASQVRCIDRYHTDEAVSRNKMHVQNNKDLYKRRQAIVEHPFGTIKRAWGYTHPLMKTIPKVETEFSIILLCYKNARQ
ncbi:MAG: transposase [Saprospiraceae bacterium]|nr:transposase [Saprospiraceae bacterium]